MNLRLAYLEKLLTDAGYDQHEIKNGWVTGYSSWYKTHAAILDDEPPLLALPQKVATQLNTFENGHFVMLEDLPEGVDMGMVVREQELLGWLKKSVKLPEEEPPGVTTTDVQSLVMQRRGQEKLRAELMAYWGGECAVSGVSTETFLVASHIKPWAACDDSREKLDSFNALLLNVALDRAFDQGYITFDDDGKIVLSARWSEDEAKLMGIDTSMRLRKIEQKHRYYLAYHRKEVFK